MAKKEKKPSHDQLAKEAIYAHFSDNSKNKPWLVTRVSLKGRALNHYVAATDFGLEVFEYNKSTLTPGVKFNWDDIQKITIDHYAIKSNYDLGLTTGSEKITISTEGKQLEKLISANKPGIKIEVVPRKFWNKILGFRSQKKWKMVTASIGYLLIIIFIVSAFTSKNDTTQNTSAPVTATPNKNNTAAKPTTSDSNTKTETKPATTPVKAQTIEEQIRQTVADTISGTAMDGKQRYEKVDITTSQGDEDKGKLLIDVHMYADDAFSVDGSMKAELMHAYDLDKALFTKYKNISKIAFWVDASLKDSYGNVKDDLWCRFVINGSDGYKMNFDNLTFMDLQKFYELQFATLEARKSWNSIQE